MSGLKLRFQHTEIDVSDGEMVIGRAPNCRVRIDHPAISRRHARILVSGDSVEIEDLGSRNGVFVNGDRIQSRRPLKVGDRVSLGNTEFQLAGNLSPAEQERTTGAIAIRRCPFCNRMFPSLLDKCPSCKATSRPPEALDEEEQARATTHTDASMHVLAGVGEKALALGRVEEAERLIGRNLDLLLERVRGGDRLDPPLFEEALKRALRLHQATKKREWLQWVFDLGTAHQSVLPSSIIDELHGTLFGQRIDLGTSLDAYIATLASTTQRPEEEQRMRRIGALLKMVRGESLS